MFRDFAYRGRGPADAGPGSFANPVLPGFHPDPSVCRVGDDYYLVCSTFAWFPGLPIFHSRNLVDWQLIGHVLDRPSQLPLAGLRVSQGLYAPTIRHHADTFYVVCTLVAPSGGGNFVVTSATPTGPWSDPVYLKGVGGIDPSLFVDDDGTFYLLHNDRPEPEPRYDGNRVIRIAEFDADTLSVRHATSHVVVDGGAAIEAEPKHLEAPHLFKKDGWYYLVAAQGGTDRPHAAVAFRSRQVLGPYEQQAAEAILTQRDLPAGRPDPITCAGHADLVQTPTGDWWAVFLACRPIEGDADATVLGRETYLLPVDWSGDWPTVLPPKVPVPRRTGRPRLPSAQDRGAGQLQRFLRRDDFASGRLGFDWNFLRTPPIDPWWRLGDGLRITPRSTGLAELEHPTMVARRQEHARCSAQVTVQQAPGSRCGLVVFQGSCHHAFFGVSREGLFLDLADGGDVRRLAARPLASTPGAVDLKMVCDGRSYRFASRASEKAAWLPLGPPIDAMTFTTARAGGFVGTFIGLYAQAV